MLNKYDTVGERKRKIFTSDKHKTYNLIITFATVSSINMSMLVTTINRYRYRYVKAAETVYTLSWYS